MIEELGERLFQAQRIQLQLQTLLVSLGGQMPARAPDAQPRKRAASGSPIGTALENASIALYNHTVVRDSGPVRLRWYCPRCNVLALIGTHEELEPFYRYDEPD